jgi:plastin-1
MYKAAMECSSIANFRSVSNFSTDVKDGENYTVLLNQLAPETCSRSPLQQTDLLQRAEMVLHRS